MDERLFGNWIVYYGPSTSELLLDPSGQYIHSFLGGERRHWGSWSIENQQGTQFLVLRLQDAYPRYEFGPFGPGPISWPSFEAWPLLAFNGPIVTIGGGFLYKSSQAAQAPPVFTPPHNQPLPLPPLAIAFPNPPAILNAAAPAAAPAVPSSSPQPAQPQSPAQPSAPAPPSASVLQQMKTAHDDWDAARKVFAQSWQQDRETDLDIQKMYQGVNQDCLNAAHDFATNIAVNAHKNAADFSNKINPPKFY